MVLSRPVGPRASAEAPCWQRASGAIASRSPCGCTGLLVAVVMLSRCPPDAWTQMLDRVSAEARLAGGGTVLIVGANSGPGPGRGSDPTFMWLAGSDARKLDKVLVEPMPHILRALRFNIRQIPRARAIGAAVADTNGWLPMFCLGASNLSTASPGVVQLSEKAQQGGVPNWVSGTCSLSRERLFSTRDFCARNRYSVRSSTVACRRPGAAAEARHAAFEELITETSVHAMTPSALLERHVHAPVVYLQIDAEGHDDQVVLQFLRAAELKPFPVAITFESMLLDESRLQSTLSHLRAAGYTQQCQSGQNVISQRVKT